MLKFKPYLRSILLTVRDAMHLSIWPATQNEQTKKKYTHTPYSYSIMKRLTITEQNGMNRAHFYKCC